MSTPPFLSFDEQVKFLQKREYFCASADEIKLSLERLSPINFHYYLGFARNFHRLANSTKTRHIEFDRTPETLEKIIKHDHEVCTLLYSGIRKAEWSLRALTVKHYCERHDPYSSFLNPEQYSSTYMEKNAKTLIEKIICEVIRYNEPYVRIALDSNSQGLFPRCPDKYDPTRYEKFVDLISILPIWSIIDSFSLGTLSKFIQHCEYNAHQKNEVWRAVANDLSIPASLFLGNLHALSLLRNLVAHNVRLWMRPTVYSPKKPKFFKNKLKDADGNSQVVAFYNLAMFQGKDNHKRKFAEEIAAKINQYPPYALGVTQTSWKDTHLS